MNWMRYRNIGRPDFTEKEKWIQARLQELAEKHNEEVRLGKFKPTPRVTNKDYIGYSLRRLIHVDRMNGGSKWRDYVTEEDYEAKIMRPFDNEPRQDENQQAPKPAPKAPYAPPPAERNLLKDVTPLSEISTRTPIQAEYEQSTPQWEPALQRPEDAESARSEMERQSSPSWEPTCSKRRKATPHPNKNLSVSSYDELQHLAGGSSPLSNISFDDEEMSYSPRSELGKSSVTPTLNLPEPATGQSDINFGIGSQSSIDTFVSARESFSGVTSPVWEQYAVSNTHYDNTAPIEDHVHRDINGQANSSGRELAFNGFPSPFCGIPMDVDSPRPVWPNISSPKWESPQKSIDDSATTMNRMSIADRPPTPFSLGSIIDFTDDEESNDADVVSVAPSTFRGISSSLPIESYNHRTPDVFAEKSTHNLNLDSNSSSYLISGDNSLSPRAEPFFCSLPPILYQNGEKAPAAVRSDVSEIYSRKM